MIEPPEVRYATSGDLNIAYQVVGDGPVDLLQVPGALYTIEAIWQERGLVQFVESLARFSRVILLDQRGTGLSDRLPSDAMPSLEERIDDVRAVMDAAGSERAVLLGMATGGPVAAVFAATYPERTHALVLGNTSPSPPDAEIAEQFTRRIEREWGTGVLGRVFGETSDSALHRFARMERVAGTPRAAAGLMRMAFATDIRAILPTIRVPTLVVAHRDHPTAPRAGVRYLADHISGARYVEFASGFTPAFVLAPSELAEILEEFVTGARPVAKPDRVLVTVLFTDIVDSTTRAAALGDRRWREVLDEHDRIIRDSTEAAGGRVVKTTGDGCLARFDGAARAIRCARRIVSEARQLGLDVRAGVHAGECELRGEDIAGITVHVGARILAMAGPGEILVTSTVRDLVIGSGLTFEERGQHALKGVPGEWSLLALSP